MLMYILTLAACVIFAWIVRVKRKINKMAEISEKLPGPKAFPLIGNLLDIGGLKLNSQPKDAFDAVIKIVNQYDPIVRLWLGPELFIILKDPRHVEIVLSSNAELHKASNYKFILPWIGYGLLTSTGSKWKKHRRIITPTFHFKILEDFIEVFNSNGQKMIEKLKNKVNKPEFDIRPYISLCALDIIAETAMGISINAQDNDEADFVQATKNMASIVLSRSFKPLLQWDPLFHLLPTGKLQRDSLRVLHTLSSQVIKTRRADHLRKTKNKITNSNGTVTDDDDVGAKKRRAFLDMLLEIKEGVALTDEEIREEVDTFMFEGHDTTTSAISFALSSLSLHPDIQEKAHEEQQAIFGDSNRQATYQDLQKMKFLEQVLKECLRLFPSVPMIGRNLTQDLDLGEYTLPKGANVIIAPMQLHREEKYYPEPENFDPERFSLENSQRRHPFHYIPFSAGPRNCIGQRFAMLEMKAIVSKMLRNFRMLPGSTRNTLEELLGELVLVNTHGIQIRLAERK